MFAKYQIGCFILLGSSIFPTLATAADITPRMELCGAMANDSRRLTCFDDLFSRSNYLYNNPPALIKGHGNWIGVKKQLIQGRANSALLLPAAGTPADDIYTPGGLYQSEPFIRIDCTSVDPEAYLHWPRDLGHRDIAIDLSFDNGSPTRVIWKVTLDGNVMRPKSKAEHQAFTNQIWNSNTLKVSIPRNGLSQRYDLAGFQGMSNAMKDECKWVGSM